MLLVSLRLPCSLLLLREVLLLHRRAAGLQRLPPPTSVARTA
jgi:hypothetical protein